MHAWPFPAGSLAACCAGLTLTSSYREFGGLSAIRIAADGAHFIQSATVGRWFQGRLTYKGGRPIEIADAVIGGSYQ
jgi:hypothetical protein